MGDIKQDISLQIPWREVKWYFNPIVCFTKEPSSDGEFAYFHSKSTSCFDLGTLLAPKLNIIKGNMRWCTAALMHPVIPGFARRSLLCLLQNKNRAGPILQLYTLISISYKRVTRCNKMWRSIRDGPKCHRHVPRLVVKLLRLHCLNTASPSPDLTAPGSKHTCPHKEFGVWTQRLSTLSPSPTLLPPLSLFLSL